MCGHDWWCEFGWIEVKEIGCFEWIWSLNEKKKETYLYSPLVDERRSLWANGNFRLGGLVAVSKTENPRFCFGEQRSPFGSFGRRVDCRSKQRSLSASGDCQLCVQSAPYLRCERRSPKIDGGCRLWPIFLCLDVFFHFLAGKRYPLGKLTTIKTTTK